MMLRILSLIITLPLSLFVVLFAIANTDIITTQIAFFDYSFDVPQYVLGLAMLAIGFICGGLLVWLNLYGYRIRYWQAKRKIAKYEDEMTNLKEKQMEKSADLTDDEPLTSLPPHDDL